MAKTIDLSKTVYELVQEFPELVEVMKEIGFSAIANPAMLKTAGRVMTILREQPCGGWISKTLKRTEEKDAR